MEDRRSTTASCCALAAALIAIAGCQTRHMPPRVSPLVVGTPGDLAISQDATNRHPRYVLCDTRHCPIATGRPGAVVSHSTPIALQVGIRKQAQTAKETTVDIHFRFNATHIDQAGLVHLRQALVPLRSTVTIVGRSDAIGSLTARRHVAQARAQAVRTAVLKERPDYTVRIELDVANDPHAPSSVRASQRRATVRFH